MMGYLVMKKLALHLKRLGSLRHKQPDVESEPKPAYSSQFGDTPEPGCLYEAQDNLEPTLAYKEKSGLGLVSTPDPAGALTSTASSRNNITLGRGDSLWGTPWVASSETGSNLSVDTARPHLEGLPSEIQRHILSAIQDLPALRALVRASPKLHRVYAQNRLHILRDCVTRSVGCDALAAFLTSTESFRRTDITQPLIQGFLDGYKESLTTGSPLPVMSNFSVRLADYIYIARFHLSTVEPLTERYAVCALAALGSSPTTAPLGETEKWRIQRAMYRLETFCNLCSERSPCQMVDSQDRLRILTTFHAWEVEEMLCIHEFAKERISSVFHQVASELPNVLEPYSRSLVDDRGGTRAQPRHQPFSNASLPTGLTERPVIERNLRNYVLSCGLTPLIALLDTTTTDELAGIIRQYLAYTDLYSYRDDWLDGKHEVMTMKDQRFIPPNNSLAISKEAQDSRRAAWSTPGDAAEDSGQELRFEGDSADSPPLAWVLYWQGKASNLFGDYVPASFRRWGYVMWDAERLDGRAKAYLTSQTPGGHTGRQPEDLCGV